MMIFRLAADQRRPLLWTTLQNAHTSRNSWSGGSFLGDYDDDDDDDDDDDYHDDDDNVPHRASHIFFSFFSNLSACRHRQ